MRRTGHPVRSERHPMRRKCHPTRSEQSPMRRTRHPTRRERHLMRSERPPACRTRHPVCRTRHPACRKRPPTCSSFPRPGDPFLADGSAKNCRGALARPARTLARQIEPSKRRSFLPPAPRGPPRPAAPLSVRVLCGSFLTPQWPPNLQADGAHDPGSPRTIGLASLPQATWNRRPHFNVVSTLFPTS